MRYFLGRTMDNLELKRDIKHFPFNIVDKGSTPAISIGYKGDMHQFVSQIRPVNAQCGSVFTTFLLLSVVNDLLIAIVNDVCVLIYNVLQRYTWCQRSLGFPRTLCSFIDTPFLRASTLPAFVTLSPRPVACTMLVSRQFFIHPLYSIYPTFIKVLFTQCIQRVI